MSFLIKNTLLFWILFSTCSFVHSEQFVEVDPSETIGVEYRFYVLEDRIKVKIILPKELKAPYSVYGLKSSDVNCVSAKIKSDYLEYIVGKYQIMDIEVDAIQSPDDKIVVFEVREHLCKEFKNSKILKDELTHIKKYEVVLDKKVDFRHDILPRITVAKGEPNIKFLSFYIKNK